MLEVHAILQRQRCNENITKKTGTLSDAYHSSSLEEFAPVSLTSSPASHSACDSGAIQTGEIRIEFPGGIIAHFSGMAESQAAMQLLTQLCNRHVLPE